jgi:hypothetical protein
VYDVVVTNSCGEVASRSAVVGGAACPADVDDGTGTGTKDCGVTVDDLIFYLGLFEQGDTRADLDNDQGVTIDDLVLYLPHYFAGC